MGVEVDKSRRDDAARRLEDDGAKRRIDPHADRGDPVVLHEHVAATLTGRVDDRPAHDEEAPRTVEARTCVLRHVASLDLVAPTDRRDRPGGGTRRAGR